LPWGQKNFVIDALTERSTLGALKAYIEETAGEGQVSLAKSGSTLSFPDHISIKKSRH